MAQPPNTVAQVIQKHATMQAASRGDAFWGSCLAVFSLSEIVGPMVGWPTISGHMYAFFGMGASFPGLAQMIGIGLPQLAIEAYAGYLLHRTNWPRWIVFRVRGLPSTAFTGDQPEGDLAGDLCGRPAGGNLCLRLSPRSWRPLATR